MKRPFKGYMAEQWEALVAPIARAAPTVAFDERALLDDLRDSLLAVGQIANGEFGEAFNEAAAYQPDPKDLARCFRTLVDARSFPLRSLHPDMGRLICRAVQSKLRARLRVGHPDRYRDVTSRFDAEKRRLIVEGFEDDPAIVHQAAEHLAIYHERSLQRGPRRKAKLDTLLFELARIFLETTRLPIDVIDLPHSDRSHFILFASAALSPLFKIGEAEANPIAKRWQELKMRSQDRSGTAGG